MVGSALLLAPTQAPLHRYRPTRLTFLIMTMRWLSLKIIGLVDYQEFEDECKDRPVTKGRYKTRSPRVRLRIGKHLKLRLLRNLKYHKMISAMIRNIRLINNWPSKVYRGRAYEVQNLNGVHGLHRAKTKK